MMIRSWFLAAALSLMPFLATADMPWMSENDINRYFSGKTIDGHYADGATFVESYGADGRIAYKDDRRQSGGHWSVQAGTFCTIYDIDPTGGCYRVQRVSENCFEFYFAARTEEQALRDPSSKSWTARGWVKGQTSTCSEAVGV
jgi:hypothetical protein